VTVEVVSLGCRLNISESEEMRGFLNGADKLVVINSCAVTSEAVRQTRQTIRRKRKANPDARLVVTGCAAEVEREMLGAMPEVDGLVANGSKLDPRAWNVPPAPLGRKIVKSRYSRAFVQVQNGCDHSCTFCVIPQGRGPSRSRSVSDVLEEIELHVEAGLNEVVLTGVHLTSWGSDLDGKPRLGALCAAILDHFPDLPRLRLSSIDGAEVDDELFELLAGEPRMMPYLHLSLQSGDDMILKRMKRRHSRRDAINLVSKLRDLRPQLGLGADMITGFPTEDEAMHRNSLSIVGELGIVHGHVFPYSARPGTPAARMPRVEQSVVKQRARELRETVERERSQWLSSMIGKPLSVLAERDGNGHSENFAPVRVPEGTMPGEVANVTPTRVAEGILV